MIKTNSELPITLLNEYNESLNDFDFVLFHLYISEPEYKKYFDDMRENHPERRLILDNSAYEFFVKGEELDLDAYEKAIIELNPDFYVLPDTLMDKNRTIMDVMKFKANHQRNIEQYFENIGESAPQPIAVVQGNSIPEFNACVFLLFNMGYKNISIPFHNGFFKDEILIHEEEIKNIFKEAGYDEMTEDVLYAMGRCMWMKLWGQYILFEIDGTPRFNLLHFLGSHCPVEKKYFNELLKDVENVSMDTGYPVKLAIEGEVLGTEKAKPKTIIDDFMHDKFSKKKKNLIESNVNIFKNY